MTVLNEFKLWVPPVAESFPDGLPQWEILGTDAQYVQFPLRPGTSITCFSGAMAYMSSGVKLAVKLAGFKKTFGRLAGGGSLFQLTYTNEGNENGYIAMTPDYPGILIPVTSTTCADGKIVALRDSFLCSTMENGVETDISAGFNPAQSVGAFCCGGFDFITQTITPNGQTAFLMAMGTVVTKTLASGESILIDGEALLGFESSVQLDIKWVGNAMAACCGGEGLFHTHLTGPGQIWLQSMGIDKMRRLFPPRVVETSNGESGDGGGE
mmetsp:Transcript_30181/g.42764  ORF Transcript_30181/g.42764 Transcript_30181/m.42764 type:complete len:268 (-) Transcript_30181:327-1130(-)|eukprot:CAMPEP_0202458486 /NCGR_PEP_ID=MMETSP1360-20130828/25947_1 /ASSEMBLY_ACC=CAM_ASM_000848 /TAXON_ID=515479 /ORGANISM="Licmophora paradoxa, Strain CCMP2313" /LENGTH=267 /DNA_ID=CAMNT_0049079061 /DNA_START=30 /DNA_END=833 /DNA_ORIENTATION=-